MTFSLSNRPFPLQALLELDGSPAGTGWEYEGLTNNQLVLTYSFSIGSSAAFQRIYNEALSELSSFLDVGFARTVDEQRISATGFQGDSGSDASADLRFSQETGGTGALAGLYFWSEDDDADMEDIDASNQIYSVNHYNILFALGTALTLTSPSGTGADALPTWARNNNYTVMHYALEGSGNTILDPAKGEGEYRHFQLYDVYALQQRFGADMTAHAGNTIHTVDSLEMDEWLRVLWDAGGTDTIDMSDQSRAQRIDLGSGKFSDIGEETGNNPMHHNLAVAIGAVIENAAGGSGADVIAGNNGRNALFGNDGADRLVALGGSDVISGGNGNDRLVGGAGNDILIGGNGNDVLIGGAGADTFRFSGPRGGIDRIDDFASGSDRISLSAANFDRTAALAFVEGDGAAATSARSTFLYDPTTGALSYDADGTGAGGAIRLATLDKGLELDIADFSFFG